jgi:putative ABC transport system permease protein
MDGLWQDLRLAFRALWKSPLATGVAMACLALGIGTNATMFSVISGTLLNPLPFRDPSQLITVRGTQRENGINRAGLSIPDLQEYQLGSRAVASLAGVASRSLTFSDTDEPERVQGAAVSWQLFSMIGIAPALGRDFTAEDDRPGAADVVVLSDELWRRRYNADPAIVGRAVTVNARPCTVIGVLPPRVKFPFLQVAWVPLAPLLGAEPRQSRPLEVFARLAPGRTLDQAREDLAGIAARLAGAYPENDGWGVRLEPLSEYFVPGDVRLVTLTAMGAVTLVLLIACANVANLLLARATTRAREMSVRAALGAGRGRIVRQLLTESVLLGAASAPLGLLLAMAGIAAIRARVPADDVPYLIDFQLDTRTIVYTVVVSAITGLVFGLTPAAHAVRGNLIAALRDGGRTGETGARHRARNVLVVAEVALSIILLVGAALFTRSFLNLQRADAGFDPAPITTARLFMPGAPYADDGVKARRVQDVVARIEALPGVQAAGASNLIPLDGGGDISRVEVEGRPAEAGREPRLFFAGVTAHYLDALGVAVARGRTFTAAESQSRSGVALVNVSMARRFFAPPESDGVPPLATGRLGGAAALGNLEPIGRRFRLLDDPAQPWLTVIGVVPDVMVEELGERDVTPAAFVPYPYQETPNTGLVIRASGDATALMPQIRAAIRASDPSLPVFAASSMEDLRRRGFWQYALFGQMFGAFGVFALLLAVVGVYGVLSFSVSQRTQEFGVRLALGAEPGDVRRLMIGQGLRLAALGIAIGLAGAVAVTRLIRSLLYDVTPTDPLSFAAVVALMLAVAATAAYLPARRATRVDPMTALRTD